MRFLRRKTPVTEKEIVKRRQEIIGMFCKKKPPYNLCITDTYTGNAESQIDNGMEEHV